MNSHQGTVLRRMCQQGNVDLAKQIIDAGANVDAAQEDGCTALWLAAEAGHLGVVQMLCGAGANMGAVKVPGNVTALYVAAQNGHVGIVDVLLMNGANPNAAKQNGSTPLHIASQQGYVDVCRLLLRFGAKHSIRNGQGVIPLHLAAYQGNEKVVRLLLAAGADPHSESQGKYTIDWAESNGYGPAIQRAIEDHTGERLVKEDADDGDMDYINESSVTAGGVLHHSIIGSPTPGTRSTMRNGGKAPTSALKQPFFVPMRNDDTHLVTYEDEERAHQDMSGWYTPQFLNRSGTQGSPNRSVTHEQSYSIAPSSPAASRVSAAAGSLTPRSAANKSSNNSGTSGFSATSLPLPLAMKREAERNHKFRSQVMRNPYDGSHEAFYSGEKFTISTMDAAYDVHSGWEHFKKRLKNQGRFLNHTRGNVPDGWMYSGNAIKKYGEEMHLARAQLAASAVERKSEVPAVTSSKKRVFTSQNSCVGLDERYVDRLRAFLAEGQGAKVD